MLLGIRKTLTAGSDAIARYSPVTQHTAASCYNPMPEEATMPRQAILVAVLFAALPLDAAEPGPHSDRQVPVMVRGEVQPATIKAGDPISLTVTITNGLPASIRHNTFSLEPLNWNGETVNISLVDIYREGPPNLFLHRPKLTCRCKFLARAVTRSSRANADRQNGRPQVGTSGRLVAGLLQSHRPCGASDAGSVCDARGAERSGGVQGGAGLDSTATITRKMLPSLLHRRHIPLVVLSRHIISAAFSCSAFLQHAVRHHPRQHVLQAVRMR